VVGVDDFMLIKYEKTGFKEETKAGARGQSCPFCGGTHMVLHPNDSGAVMHCSKTGKVVAKIVKDEVQEQGRDDLAQLPVYPAGKRLARKHGLKAMMNTDIWDRLSTMTNQGSSKLSIKDKGVRVGRKESVTRQLLQQVCETDVDLGSAEPPEWRCQHCGKVFSIKDAKIQGQDTFCPQCGSNDTYPEGNKY
jgi:predicted  nucleic acid-binding Zn-ribbon protein